MFRTNHMTNSLARLIGFPFALAMIICFSLGGLDVEGPKTLIILFSLIALSIIFFFNKEIDGWWWRRKQPDLDKTLKAWMLAHVPYYKSLDAVEQEAFGKRISVFNFVKNFTLKVEKDYQLEEDVKAIISHEFQRVTQYREEYMYKPFKEFVVYNHPFASPSIKTLHTMEVNTEDGVVILSKEQLINGFRQPARFLNIALLAAVQCFTIAHPRLPYPKVVGLNKEDIAEGHDINLEVVLQGLGAAHITNLDLLAFCFFQYPNRLASFSPEIYTSFEKIFYKNA